MDDYNRYVTAVNKIFDYLEKMKAGWNNPDNKNYIDSIDEFKNIVISKAEDMRKPPTVTLEKTSAELDAEQEAELEKAAQERAEQDRMKPPMPDPNGGSESYAPGPSSVEALGQ